MGMWEDRQRQGGDLRQPQTSAAGTLGRQVMPLTCLAPSQGPGASCWSIVARAESQAFSVPHTCRQRSINPGKWGRAVLGQQTTGAGH